MTRLWLSLLIQVSMAALEAPQAIPRTQSPEVSAADSRTAIVRGMTTDAKTGAPLRGVQLTMRLAGHGEVEGSASSDANGNYEIRAAPGQYSVVAARDEFVLNQYLDSANVPALELGAGQEAAVDFHMIPGATIAGTVTDVNGAPIPQAIIQGMARVYRQGRIEWQLRTAAKTNEHGEYRLTDLPAGRYYLRAGKPGTASPNTRTFVMLGYPRASRIEDAQPIPVNTGESKRAIDFRLPDTDTHSVSGRVSFLATGRPVVDMAIRVDPAYPDYGTSTSVHSGAGGTFRLDGLIDGHYRIEGSLAGDDERGPGGHFIRFLEVKASDVTDLTIQVGIGTTVKGNLKAVSGSPPGRMTVQLFSRSPFGDAGNRQAFTWATYGPDGAFEVINVPPGVYDLKVINSANAGPQAEFFVQSVTVEGQDVYESGIRLSEGIASVTVSVAVDFSPGTITGRTLDFQNQPLPGANLVLMSADPKKRLLDPYWRQIKSNRGGAFRIGSLIPGDYLLIVWPGFRPWDGLDPEAFAILERHAVRVRVERSRIVSRNLRLTKEMRARLDALSLWPSADRR